MICLILTRIEPVPWGTQTDMEPNTYSQYNMDPDQCNKITYWSQ